MSWKVLVTARAMQFVGRPAVELLEKAGCAVVRPPRSGSWSGAELENLLAGVDATLTGHDHYTEAILGSKAAAQLKIISRWGVGYDSIDVPAATRHGMVVAYTPGLTDEGVADFAFALLLGIARRIAVSDQTMRQGHWRPAWGHDLPGKTLGILGFGRIGRAVARRASGFDLKVIACNRSSKPGTTEGSAEFVSFDDLLKRSDFLTVHASASAENRHLMGEAQFRKMKPTSYFINTARGSLVDEAALDRALREGWIAGAALDVFENEPLPAESPLRTAPNLVMTPHQATSSHETGESVSLAAAQAIVDLKQGRKPKMVVNPEVFGAPQLRAKVE